MKKINHILLIDDDHDDNVFHETVIKQCEIAAHLNSFLSSVNALDYFRDSLIKEDNSVYPTPDLVLLDINMPALNGFEFLDRLRIIPDPYNRKKKMKIFMLTGSSNPDDRTKATEQYSDLVTGYKIKPLVDTAFLEIVQTHFQKPDQQVG